MPTTYLLVKFTKALQNKGHSEGYRLTPNWCPSRYILQPFRNTNPKGEVGIYSIT